MFIDLEALARTSSLLLCKRPANRVAAVAAARDTESEIRLSAPNTTATGTSAEFPTAATASPRLAKRVRPNKIENPR